MCSSFYTLSMNKGWIQPDKYSLYCTSIFNFYFYFIFFCVMSRVEWWENRSFWASEIRILLEFRAHILHRGVMHICTCGSKYCNLIFRATLIFLMQLLLPLKLKKMCFSKWSQDCLHYHCWYFGFWNDIIELFFLCLSAIQILFALLFQKNGSCT